MTVHGAGSWVLDGEAHSIERLVEEVGASHARLERLLRKSTQSGAVRESRLPGWTNAHLVCHLERNAASHIRLLEAAVAGEMVDQYEGGDAGRQAAIESGSRRPLGELVADLIATNRRLEQQWGSMTIEAWLSPTRARAGTRRAYLCPWAR